MTALSRVSSTREPGVRHAGPAARAGARYRSASIGTVVWVVLAVGCFLAAR